MTAFRFQETLLPSLFDKAVLPRRGAAPLSFPPGPKDIDRDLRYDTDAFVVMYCYVLFLEMAVWIWLLFADLKYLF